MSRGDFVRFSAGPVAAAAVFGFMTDGIKYRRDELCVIYRPWTERVTCQSTPCGKWCISAEVLALTVLELPRTRLSECACRLNSTEATVSIYVRPALHLKFSKIARINAQMFLLKHVASVLKRGYV